VPKSQAFNLNPNPTNPKTNPKPNPTDATNPTLQILTLFKRMAKNFYGITCRASAGLSMSQLADSSAAAAAAAATVVAVATDSSGGGGR